MRKKTKHLWACLLVISWLILLYGCKQGKKTAVQRNLVLLAGEPTSGSILLQCRFAVTDTLVDHDIPGSAGTGCFQVSRDSSFSAFKETPWIPADKKNDFIIRKKVYELQPNTSYYYRARAVLWANPDTVHSLTGRFSTLPGPEEAEDICFAMSTGFNYEKFYGIGRPANGGRGKIMAPPATGIDRKLGFEAFDAVREIKPDFFIANGDVVYYDSPTEKPEMRAKTKEQMQAKWHRFFSMPRNRKMCLQIPVFYLKDDHDHRFNDCDTTNSRFKKPSHQLGICVFREQVPVVDLENPDAVTYRTVRAGKDLQLWFMEGRDYRSPNKRKDTPEKSIWGKEQKEWLKRTLLESDATFKILVSPTPMIGPDDAYKIDNHTNPGGFQSEGRAFISWLAEKGFSGNDFFFLCGDRHWQYHSIHPSGFEEFSCGAFVDQNSRPGRLPGDPQSTDPDSLLRTPYIQAENWGGGFLTVKSFRREGIPVICFGFHDKYGKCSSETEKQMTNKNQLPK